MRLPAKDSATWKALMTGLQVFLGFLAGLLAMPEFRELVLQFYPQAVPIIVSLSGIIAFVIGFVRPSVKNY